MAQSLWGIVIVFLAQNLDLGRAPHRRWHTDATNNLCACARCNTHGDLAPTFTRRSTTLPLHSHASTTCVCVYVCVCMYVCVCVCACVTPLRLVLQKGA